MVDDIMLPPDPARIMEGLRDTGYDFTTAVADIIDNSIAAGATDISVHMDLSPKGSIRIYVADNGCGMNFDELKNAMRYGSNKRSDPKSLGKFGLGLKTASTAFCRSLSVISRGSDNIPRKVQWDIDHIAATGTWSLRTPEVNEDEMESLEDVADGGTGTLVVWEKIDRLLQDVQSQKAANIAFKKLKDQLEFHIALVYQRFIDHTDNRVENVTIYLNDKKVEPWDPFCTNEKNAECLGTDDVEIEMPGIPEIPTLHIKAVLIPRRDEFSSKEAGDRAKVSNDMQGFYVYRENRLIHYGDWMGMFTKEPHGTLLRVELSFDYRLDDAFHVDIKKSRILLNEELYNYIKDSFMPAPRRAADERYRLGTKKQTEKVAANAHEASNRNIDEKASAVENAKIQVTNAENGEVKITNVNGSFHHKITVHTAEKEGQYRVIPVSSLDSGILWAPGFVEGRHAVQINTSHPYYQKVYLPVLSQNVMVTGMDALLWALAEAELSTFSDETKEQYEDMRIQVSRCLKRLLADLPEPRMEEE